MEQDRTGGVVINMPYDVKAIIATLENAGFEGYAVGGCVRDAVLGRTPQDWDITTSALPDEVKRLFKRTVDTGIEHGTVTVMIGAVGYEVTTYRIDGEYEDMRHPKSVEFSKSLLEDLKRRDFTINAMAYNDAVGLVDRFNGQEDLRRGVIRCVGNPAERFQEDALRMMRAVRFAAQLGFSIEEGTWKAIQALAPNIGRVSRERIAVELGKTLLSDRPQYVKLFSECGVAAAAFVQLDDAMEGNDAQAALEAVKAATANLPLRYAALMNCQGETATKQLLKGLKLDNYTVKTAAMLVANCRLHIELNEQSVRRALNRFDAENLFMILDNQENMVTAKEHTEGVSLKDAREQIQKLRAMMNVIIKRGDCYRVCDLAIGGRELMALGYTGSAIGEKLKELLELVMENPQLNTREELLALSS